MVPSVYRNSRLTQGAELIEKGAGSRSGEFDPIQRAALFHSRECRNFWRHDTRPEYDQEPMLVWENRIYAMMPKDKRPASPPLTDVVWCPKLNLVYVDNVKAGSTTMMGILSREYNCTWHTHTRWPPAQARLARAQCKGLSHDECQDRRSRTDWLDDAVLSGATFFSIVREPIARFQSGYKQAVTMDAKLANLTIAEYVEEYKLKYLNEHTLTQSRRLSGWDAHNRQVPMHFIASLENLEHDMAALWARLGLAPLAAFPRMRAAEMDASKAALDTRLTPVQVRVLCAHLAQDFVCFGYALPEACRGGGGAAAAAVQWRRCSCCGGVAAAAVQRRWRCSSGGGAAPAAVQRRRRRSGGGGAAAAAGGNGGGSDSSCRWQHSSAGSNAAAAPPSPQHRVRTASFTGGECVCNVAAHAARCGASALR
ncbi:hypothetical protein JKP88DRAFT_289200 [Tribonema minus]|uniref:Sulfotransferase n=1 Tax=Tribonema minus TaxID=303371 RepID=A0A836CHK8_9STRA|nr:hypothetical protein JKP88DRAFT_289200 [Tribonema minus]